jgi:hypothetical protein
MAAAPGCHQPVTPIVLAARVARRSRMAIRFMLGLAKLVQEIFEPIGDALANNFIVNPLQDIPEPALVLAAEASSGLSYLSVRVHGRLWRRWLCYPVRRSTRTFRRRYRLGCLLLFHFFARSPCSRPAGPSVLIWANVTQNRSFR